MGINSEKHYLNETLFLIDKHIEYMRRRFGKNKEINCFSYQGLRLTWKYYRDLKRVSCDWETIARTIRRLANQGVLTRQRKKRFDPLKNKYVSIMKFCLNKDYQGFNQNE